MAAVSFGDTTKSKPALTTALTIFCTTIVLPMRAVIQGVDDTWEISLLKFTVEMIEKSKSINEFDFKRRGLL